MFLDMSYLDKTYKIQGKKKMSIMMYCPNCKTNVLTTREDFRIGLAIILAIFTGGIGLLIYLAIYLDKQQIFCIHCKSECQIRQEDNQLISNYQVINSSNQSQLMLQPIEKQVTIEDKSKFCYNCGTKLSERQAKFCPLCGSNIE